MSMEFKLPAIGEGVDSADVAEVLVQEGQTITAGTNVLELETEKAVVEVPCPHAGKISKILVKDGDTIKVGQAILVIDGAAAGGSAPESKPAPAAKAPETKAADKPAAKPAEAPAPASKSNGGGGGGSFEFTLPSVGEGVTSADVAEILVKEGDEIAAGQAVMELETEKAVVEVPSPQAGKIGKIHVKNGDTIKPGQVILTILGAGAASAPTAKPAAPKEDAPAPAKEAPAKEPARQPTTVMTTAETVSGGTANNGQSGPATPPAPAAPSTRRMARELGVDLRQLAGTGPGGRITHEDVQAYVRGRMQTLTTQKPAAAVRSVGGGLTAPPLPDFSRFGPVKREAMSKIYRTAAENLTVAWNVIPHVTQHDRADITDLEAARKKFSDGIGKNGPKVTMTAIVMKALARCLQAFPKFNSSLDPETFEIVFKQYINIGCAVDTPNGLLVPVVKDCDKKSILQIASDLTDLAGKAREKKLPIDSMQGATCTVTNLGGIGGVGFTPIVNYPEVCILGMSRGQSELKLVDGKVVERLMLPLSLSYDHRVINGADAARFLVTLCNMLADPFQLLAAC
ncbi:dihydrolipoyllysine-residue acetyltransferase [Planctomyces sp. SH-PL14]|uniref:dihydrolipoyllysine-residue acetyltransferase n=1 Tax=Planctomyces sp. SH-PL14 TaxID=1632864 RepID=UPI00078DBEB5|nr:dihydrolipoyllysine-residue acetyltransferase [Planctomyces sp. SH-PL14]AMV16882.1 Dihydrolipoyllysine-residue acetyltransferase component of pyruvate dehydrogenase complex [Planctomyces sp. SH-PL14]